MPAKVPAGALAFAGAKQCFANSRLTPANACTWVRRCTANGQARTACLASKRCREHSALEVRAGISKNLSASPKMATADRIPRPEQLTMDGGPRFIRCWDVSPWTACTVLKLSKRVSSSAHSQLVEHPVKEVWAGLEIQQCSPGMAGTMPVSSSSYPVNIRNWPNNPP